ncbi:MAG: LysR family transcriptional regulator, partial [Catenulispora sp.]|nr:LysR family transcriptional regulator [Catenulispora sp.]
RYFVAVAEERHFSRAAARLYISTPTLSQQIKSVEREIGAPLLVRGRDGVTLTAAGAVLLEAGRKLLRAADDAVAEVRAAAGVETPTLRFGLLNGAPDWLVDALTLGPTVFTGGTTSEQVERLQRGDVDLALLRAPVDLPRGVGQARVAVEELGVMMAAGHPLADREVLDPVDVNGLELILFPRDSAPGTHDAVLATFRRHGAEVVLSNSAMGYAQMPSALRSKPTAIGLSSERGKATPGLVWRPLRGAPISVTYIAAWRSGFQPPAAVAVLAAALGHA